MTAIGVATALSVNLNKIAVLRNSRGGREPDVLAAGVACLDAGAHGLTVHPRPDARHIRSEDVYALGALCETLRFGPMTRRRLYAAGGLDFAAHAAQADAS